MSIQEYVLTVLRCGGPRRLSKRCLAAATSLAHGLLSVFLLRFEVLNMVFARLIALLTRDIDPMGMDLPTRVWPVALVDVKMLHTSLSVFEARVDAMKVSSTKTNARRKRGWQTLLLRSRTSALSSARGASGGHLADLTHPHQAFETVPGATSAIQSVSAGAG